MQKAKARSACRDSWTRPNEQTEKSFNSALHSSSSTIEVSTFKWSSYAFELIIASRCSKDRLSDSQTHRIELVSEDVESTMKLIKQHL